MYYNYYAHSSGLVAAFCYMSWSIIHYILDRFVRDVIIIIIIIIIIIMFCLFFLKMFKYDQYQVPLRNFRYVKVVKLSLKFIVYIWY